MVCLSSSNFLVSQLWAYSCLFFLGNISWCHGYNPGLLFVDVPMGLPCPWEWAVDPPVTESHHNPGIACLLISCSFYRRFQILVSSLMVWITACLWAILLFLILFSFTFGCPSGFYSPWHFLSKIFPSLLFTTVLSLSDSSFISNYIFIRNQK